MSMTALLSVWTFSYFENQMYRILRRTVMLAGSGPPTGLPVFNRTGGSFPRA